MNFTLKISHRNVQYQGVKKVRADLLHQIWWAETNQEEKEIERRKNTQLTPEQEKENMKKYIAWKVKYLREFLKDR